VTVVTRSALDRHAKILERQPRVVRRRSARVVSRFAVLIVFDFVAFLAARAVSGVILTYAAAFFPPRFDLQTAGPLAPPGHPASLVFPVVLFAALAMSGSYARHRPLVVGLRLLTATAISSAATAVALATLIGMGNAALFAFGFGAICFLFLSASRVAAEAFTTAAWPRHRGALPAVRLATEGTTSGGSARWGDYVVVSELRLETTAPVSSVFDHVQRVLQSEGAEALIVTHDVTDAHLLALVESVLELGGRIIYPARAVPLAGFRPRLLWHGGKPFLEIGTPALRASAVLTKRVSDILGATLLLLIASPLLAMIALAVRIDGSGPVLFSQARVGLGGRRFRMLKFRTMTVGADDRKQELAHLNRSGDVRLFKIPSDPRVTRVGRFLRRWSLDELPQLLNVLKGEMSLVGPRPFFESDFTEYEDRHFRRLDTKPGITGLWQVSGRSDVVNFDDVIFLDRQYIEQWSLWLDISILLRTIPAVMRRTGAY
jgi:exopolysaccharide biosynthesis polyprenyl glycosylphosphotransferase